MSYNEGFIKRKMERSGYCRGCDKELRKNDEIIYTYTFRNRGQHILICLDCAEVISDLMEVENENIL